MRGYHCLTEIHGVSVDKLDADFLNTALSAAIEAGGGQPIGKQSMSYPGHGLTIIVFAAESHALATTWPEFGVVLFDILLCGDGVDAKAAEAHFVNLLRPVGDVFEHSVERVIRQTTTATASA